VQWHRCIAQRAMDLQNSPNPARRELLTVDLCGLRQALDERSASTGEPAAAIVRDALATALRITERVRPFMAAHNGHGAARVRVSLRLTQQEAAELSASAAAAGLSLGRYAVALMRNSRQPESSVVREGRVAALIRSNAEMSTLSRNVARLTALLSQGSVGAAREYYRLLETLSGEIRSHLVLASGLLKD
jgi:hypothetical protein